jgi:hypothetical protein
MKQHHDSFSSKTLIELEDSPVREPTETDTHLIRTCLRLMRVPLNQLTTENLRMLIGQQIGGQIPGTPRTRYVGAGSFGCR